MARVSVIVPSYNHGRFLRTCIESVIAQTFQDWEIVLVDDGSSDDSVDIAHGLAREEPRMRLVVNESNLGTYGAQAAALELATGDLVAVLNSDDVWLPEKLEEQVALMDAHAGLPLCYSLGAICDAQGTVDGENEVHGEWPRSEVQDVLPWLLRENRILASGVVFRRDRLRFDPGLRYSGDWVAVLRLAARGEVGCLSSVRTLWRIHGSNTFSLSEGQALEEVRVRRAILARGLAWARPGQDETLVRVGLGHCALHLSALLVLFGDMAGARAAALSARKLMGTDRRVAKRLAASMLPVAFARKRLWPTAGPFIEPAKGRLAARNLKALDFDLG